MILTYQAQGKALGSGSPMDVFIDEHQIGQVTLRPGLLVTGPTWTWHNRQGPEWTLSNKRSTYTLRTTDGRDVGVLIKQRMKRNVDLSSSDGWTGAADHVGWGSGATTVRSMDGNHVATVSRRTSIGQRMFGSKETWDLTIHAELPVHAQYVVSAVPLVIDHLQRKAEADG